MRMGVVADDITGATDIGIMFAKGGYVVHVYSFAESLTLTGLPAVQQADICILDTDSRFDSSEVAYLKVHRATLALLEAGARSYFNKTCSVFRGNVGAEFDAMLDALGESFALVVLGFPRNGRITVNGTHYVHGKRLEASEFRSDPVHPMTRSDLVGILQEQTSRSVGLATHDLVAQGPERLRDTIEQFRDQIQYLILDVADQSALATIARAASDATIICGSSALAEELPSAWDEQRVAPEPPALPARSDCGVLCVAGSLMPQTAAQLEHLQTKDVPSWELDTLDLLDPCSRIEEIERLTEAVSTSLLAGHDAVLHTSNRAEQLDRTRTEARSQGYTRTELSRLVSGTLADLTSRVVARSGTNRLAVAGGDTSAAICRQLGISGLRIWQEIQPGLPSCLTLDGPPMMIVLKSGSFGTPDFLSQAMHQLRHS